MFKLSAKNVFTNTGDEPRLVALKDIQRRVSLIPTSSKRMRSVEAQVSRLSQTYCAIQPKIIQDAEQLPTNFNPSKSGSSKATIKFSSNHISPSIQLTTMDAPRKRPFSSYKGLAKTTKPKPMRPQKVSKEVAEREMGEFEALYERLADIMEAIKQGSIELVESSIENYVEFIQAKQICFIDDFIQGRDKKLQRVIRTSRLHESLSIAYLFLEVAQERAYENLSNVVNFIGYCLSNVLLMVRVYWLTESTGMDNSFEQLVRKAECNSYGQRLTNVQDVLLRMQHNNEIITIVHKKLGRFNPKFELCIQMFFKNAERQGISSTQCTYYIFEYLSLHIHEAELTGLAKCLQTAPQPYCPPPSKPYTLVIQPLSILVHQTKLRPYFYQFIQWAHKHFQLILWTWEMPYEPEVREIYAKLDHYLSYRLYQHHCIEQDGVYVKDLSRLGRDVEKVVIIDYDKRIYGRQPENGIELRWKSKKGDKGLLCVSQILQEMVASSSGVADTLRIYSEELYALKGI